jgi:ribosomal protein S18 acetylase RimI-like enzyme
VGFVAGHLTARHGCHGELEWINVIRERRRDGVASQLLRLLARWFFQQGAFRVCVDVNPANPEALAFYMRNGAERLNENWLVWNDIRIVMGKQRERARRTRDGRTLEASRYGKLSQRAFEKIMQSLVESLASPCKSGNKAASTLP